jgi:hypothetical protein
MCLTAELSRMWCVGWKRWLGALPRMREAYTLNCPSTVSVIVSTGLLLRNTLGANGGVLLGIGLDRNTIQACYYLAG